MRVLSCFLGLSVPLLVVSAANASKQPTPSELRTRYARADSLKDLYSNKIFRLRIQPHWYAGSGQFWYENDLEGGVREFVAVDTAAGRKRPLFNNSHLANALAGILGHPVASVRLPISLLQISVDGSAVQFNCDDRGFQFDLRSETLREVAPLSPPPPRVEEPMTQDLWAPEESPVPSPDRKWTAQIKDLNVTVKDGDGEETALTTDGGVEGYYARLEWRPDSKKLIAWQVIPGDRRSVYFVESSPPGGGRAVLHTRVYDVPGDKTDHFDLYVIDPETKESYKATPEPVDYGDMPDIRWDPTRTRFTYEKMDRGFQRYRVIQVDTEAGTSKNLVDDEAKTFIDGTAAFTYYCESGEIIWRSERDGWGHLYLSDMAGHPEHQITHGRWVVRSVVRVDESKRQILFMASGVVPGEDPYFTHCYKINFDGTELTPLTPQNGNHSVQLSPDGKSLIDSYSTVSDPPVHELRRVSDGALIATLERSDETKLCSVGWKAPEVFVAKGRDGLTDIWGVVYRPREFNPAISYPVVEDIYAGPQDSFVPKSFAPYRPDQSLAELGFIVVQIDGMGTRNRSKSFHDVAWKNLADAGFPDRILWMKALARKYPYIDLSRVGVFGSSAGGQESAAALLFHSDFYKVAVSCCGCHDSRMDRLWWNEQWMGYPVGPEYEEQSNITNAARLKGKLLLMVAEMDTNVPPESTYRLADALIKAGKEFQFLTIPGCDHTDGGSYGERKRRDFFVRNLLGWEPPDWNLSERPFSR